MERKKSKGVPLGVNGSYLFDGLFIVKNKLQFLCVIDFFFLGSFCWVFFWSVNCNRHRYLHSNQISHFGSGKRQKDQMGQKHKSLH